MAVGALYPAYQTFKAVEYMRVHGETDEAARWLMYWSIYSLFGVAEKIAGKLVQWYVDDKTCSFAACS